MRILQREIEDIIKNKVNDDQTFNFIKTQTYLPPFSLENCQMAYLLSKGALTFEHYLQLNSEYYKRNKYLHLFEMAPRTFGETFGEQHILNLFPDDFIKATSKTMANIFPDYDGEFDLCLDSIRVEVKACRANNTKSKTSLASRAYTHTDALNNNFNYHYQQLKPSCCDIFIWIGVCTDEIMYWIISSEELKNCGYLGSQHRNENTGIKGVEVYEGQVFMTEAELQPYQVSEKDIPSAIKNKYKKLYPIC